jgi:hypothetical protein
MIVVAKWRKETLPREKVIRDVVFSVGLCP